MVYLNCIKQKVSQVEHFTPLKGKKIKMEKI